MIRRQFFASLAALCVAPGVPVMAAPAAKPIWCGVDFTDISGTPAWAIVGARGPELLTLPRGARIVP